MSEKTVLGDMHENRNIRKQIGCMKGVFQLFDRHHFLSGWHWHTNSHKHKRPVLGAQHQLKPHNATKAVTDKAMELQKQKPRITKGSSQASNSSSSCSPTFSSLDHSRTNISERPFQITAKKDHGPSSSKGPKSPHIRDAAMYREARGVPIKSFTNDEKVTVIKQIDSPRPSHKSKFEKPKATAYEESNRAFARDERLIIHRLSYDGRESRDTLKTKHKELPRLSLDSKASSIKCSGLDSKLNFLGQESGSHSRTSSIVAKLMGLNDFQETITTDENKITKLNSSPRLSPSPSPRVGFLSRSSTTTKESKEKQNTLSETTTSSWLPIEPAPWKQAQSKKSQTNTQISSSSSVYAEMEKRITELEFKEPGKDLRALKQILEAMQKTRDKLENQSRKPAELQKQKQLCSSKKIARPAKVIEKVKFSSSSKVPTAGKTHIQNLQTQGTKYHNRKKKAFREKAKDFIKPTNNGVKEPSKQFSSADKKITSRNLEIARTLRAPQRIRVGNCTTSERDFERSSESSRIKKVSSKKVREDFSLSKKTKVIKSTDFQLSDDQLSELSSELRYSNYQGDTASIKSESNNSVASHFETEAMSLASSTNRNFREQQDSVSTSKEHMPAVELAEQPSPVSVLDTAFYTEDLPSPVKKISTDFQEWPLENLNHFSDCTQSNPGYYYNQKNILPLIHEPRLLKTEPSQTAENHDESVTRNLMPDNRYINRILTASGLLKETCIMPTANHIISSHPINPHIFHVLEEMEEENRKLTEKNNPKGLNQKMQRRVVFDMVNEILVHKITSHGLFTLRRKRMNSQGLLKELYLEMDRLSEMPYGNLDDEDGGSIRLLTADMKYQSDDWTDYSGEVPALVLEIECLIFKDLINEVVTGQVEGLHDLPKKHCRQLFTK